MSRLSDVKVVDPGADVAALDDAADVFGLLSDPGRLRLLVVLLDGESSVGRLAEAAHLSESSASHALRLLRAHRVVTARRDGRMVYYRLGDDHVRQLLEVALQHAQHSSLLHPVGGH
jgi:ArsR family transcriptional regulator, lead/cadmium/zinc/bismuth-responsive transcriptional repressor